MLQAAHHKLRYDNTEEDLIRALNCTAKSIGYVTNLKNRITSALLDLFKAVDRIKLMSLLDELSGDPFLELEKVGIRLIWQNFLHKFSRISLLTRVELLLERFASINYNIDQSQYELYELDDPFFQHFGEEFVNLTQPYKVH